MEVYRIKDWEKNFENHKTRILKNLAWVPFPNKHDGDGYTELIGDHPNGVAHYGVWCALVQVASKCSPRGTLLRDENRPHTADTLSRMTRIPPQIITEALERLSGTVKWMEVVTEKELTESGATAPPSGATVTLDPALDGRRTELNRTEQKELNRTESAVGRSVDSPVGEEKRGEIKREWDRIREVVPIKDGTYNLDDRQELFKIATMRVLGFVSEDVIEDTLDAVRRKKPNPAWKFFRKGVIARSQGFPIEDLLARMAIPEWAVPLVNNQARTVNP